MSDLSFAGFLIPYTYEPNAYHAIDYEERVMESTRRDFLFALSAFPFTSAIPPPSRPPPREPLADPPWSQKMPRHFLPSVSLSQISGVYLSHTDQGHKQNLGPVFQFSLLGFDPIGVRHDSGHIEFLKNPDENERKWLDCSPNPMYTWGYQMYGWHRNIGQFRFFWLFPHLRKQFAKSILMPWFIGEDEFAMGNELMTTAAGMPFRRITVG